MKFRKKPVVIEAWLWDGKVKTLDILDKIPGFIEAWLMNTVEPDGETALHLRIGTTEGPHNVSVGDWIIKGVKGEFYCCKPDIFEMTYEPVEETTSPLGDNT